MSGRTKGVSVMLAVAFLAAAPGSTGAQTITEFSIPEPTSQPDNVVPGTPFEGARR